MNTNMNAISMGWGGVNGFEPNTLQALQTQDLEPADKSKMPPEGFEPLEGSMKGGCYKGDLNSESYLTWYPDFGINELSRYKDFYTLTSDNNQVPNERWSRFSGVVEPANGSVAMRNFSNLRTEMLSKAAKGGGWVHTPSVGGKELMPEAHGTIGAAMDSMHDHVMKGKKMRAY